jgi:hypothetical protein
MNDRWADQRKRHLAGDATRVLEEHFRCLQQHATFENECDARSVAKLSSGGISVPRLPSQLVDHLRLERYQTTSSSEQFFHSLYYRLRPFLPCWTRNLIHRAVAQWRLRSPFPSWPVDGTVEEILEFLIQSAIQSQGGGEIPFVWFWPEGHTAALMMTHDVEGKSGAIRCQQLMDLDDSIGLKAAFQLIPEGAYDFEGLLGRIRERGFETNIHDLGHDGSLYQNEAGFRQRVQKVNAYARKHGIQGFRSGSMYRRQDWFGLLNFQYDMSVPNAALLEPQMGGCCTVMPYFVGEILELPLTMVQDHGLLYILGERSIEFWKSQIELVYRHNGLISFIVHPDYLAKPEERRIYGELLAYIARLQEERGVWLAVPGEINRWWRQRSQMRLARGGNTWQVTGEGSERARVAYARLEKGRVTCRIERPAILTSAPPAVVMQQQIPGGTPGAQCMAL